MKKQDSMKALLQKDDEKKIVEEQKGSEKQGKSGNVAVRIVTPSKFTYFILLLYPDCAAHLSLIQSLLSDDHPYGFRSCMIAHDRDEWKEGDANTLTTLDWTEKALAGEDMSQYHMIGEVKKLHVHVLVQMPYPMSEKCVQRNFKFLGIEERFIQGVECVVGMSMYLTHDDPASRMAGKHVYSMMEIRGDTEILQRDERQSIDEFLMLIEGWKSDHTIYASFASLVGYLSDCGFLHFIKAQGFLATKIMTEAVIDKQRLNADADLVNGQYTADAPSCQVAAQIGRTTDQKGTIYE